MRKLNILHVITKLELGGAEKDTSHIVDLLNKDRYNLSLVSSNEGTLIADTLNLPQIKTSFLPTLKRAIDPLKDLLTSISLTRFIKDKKFDSNKLCTVRKKDSLI